VCSSQKHHTISNKNKKSINEFNRLKSDFKINSSLKGDWNLNAVPGHAGRHTKVYHRESMNLARTVASKNVGNSPAFEQTMTQFGRGLTGDMMQRVGKQKIIDYVARFIGGL